MRAIDNRLALLRVQWTAATLRRHTAPVPHIGVCDMRRHKRLRLGGHWGKNTFLLEALAVDAAAIFGCFEPRAANLINVSQWLSRVLPNSLSTHLAPPAITACYRCPLPWCRLVEAHMLRWTTPVRILRMSWIHVVSRVAVEVLVLLLRRR